ncbi:MAG: cysteine desulfurase [Rhodobiaceae bacterium]|nr:cysteine desulfurase [Rhodobiaceae bacterium]
MTATRHYLDHNATTPLCGAARDAMAKAFDVVGNPSSVHAFGRGARGLVEAGRRALADAMGTTPDRVVFTSGASEANNQIICHAAEAGWPVHVSAVEHLSVRDAFEERTVLPVDAAGRIDLDALEALLPQIDDDGGAGEPFLVCVMFANNETGVIQPVRAVADLVHARGGYVHVDAVQGLGKVPMDPSALGADYLSVSAHKFGGPAGIGALVRMGCAPDPVALIRGGGQERNRRAGTENLIGVAGMAGALGAVGERLAEIDRIGALRDKLEDALVAISPDVTIYGKGAERLANTSCFSAPGVSAETAVIRFDLAGVAVGSGSACSSGKVSPSHVLEAMGADRHHTASAIRVSLGPETTKDDIEAAIAVWKAIAAGVRQEGAAAA